MRKVGKRNFIQLAFRPDNGVGREAIRKNKREGKILKRKSIRPSILPKETGLGPIFCPKDFEKFFFR